jgi:hypothetical protein
MGTKEDIQPAALKLRAESRGSVTGDGVTIDPRQPVTLQDFYAFMPLHRYLYIPSRDLWPASSVNARIPPLPLLDIDGKPVFDSKKCPQTIPASVWLDRHRPVEQMTWAPGKPELIHDWLIADGGWLEQRGVRVFNLYRPPRLELGDPAAAVRWIDHLHRIYRADADHITRWFAHRVQRPGEKINHAIVLGGPQGIGKDSLIEPVKRAVGPWNCHEVSPVVLLGRFNEHLQSVILRVSEARDLGEVNSAALYEHMKTITAAPPDVLRVDRKHIREFAIPNVCGVIITTNHRTNALYLPADDRRHYVAWSPRTKEEFSPEYWEELWTWYDSGGDGHVAAYLHTFDLSGFRPKAPPPKTEAFRAIVDASRAPEESDIADAIDKLGNPPAVTLAQIADAAGDSDFRRWITDKANRRQLPHRLEAAGYVQVVNGAAQDGLWKVAGQRVRVYARHDLPLVEQHRAATQLIEESR